MSILRFLYFIIIIIIIIIIIKYKLCQLFLPHSVLHAVSGFTPPPYTYA
jgi:uncharacterized membrane protein